MNRSSAEGTAENSYNGPYQGVGSGAHAGGPGCKSDPGDLHPGRLEIVDLLGGIADGDRALHALVSVRGAVVAVDAVDAEACVPRLQGIPVQLEGVARFVDPG